MGLSGALEWWDEWQLRILVLGSLFVQYMLFFSSVVRRCALPPWLRLFIWLSYLGGQALAIYALATLFNRHRQQEQEQVAAGLEVLWAPVLLIHLGGQHMITAYSIEDNELWMRRAATAASQVVIALYVFCKSWPGSGGEKRLLRAAILLFVVGILRSIQKPCSLRSASISNMVAAFSMSTRKHQTTFTYFCKVMCGCMEWYFAGKKTQEEKAQEKDILLLEEFVQEVVKNLPELLASDQEEAEILADTSLEVNVLRSLVDISPPYSSRIKNLQLSMGLDYWRAHRISLQILNHMFLFLYTKLFMSTGMDVCCLPLCFPFLALASAILFSTNSKYHDYNQTDVKVTSILFWCTAVLDFLSFFIGPIILIKALGDRVPQHNLLSFCARNKRPTILMKLASLVWCKDYVNMHCYTEQAPKFSLLQVTELIHGYVRDGWKGYIHDDASYRRFNSRRGQWALRHRRHLRWSLKMSFDGSILIWHIATDLCFHHHNTTPGGQGRAIRSRVISNYMAYLLLLRPDMLMPGSRIGTFTVACEDVELLLGGEHAMDDETGLAQGILLWAQAQAQQPPLLDDDANMVGSLVPMACKLAEALMDLREEERWEVVQGVWVEMLCYSAGRCRGHLHAKNMGEGMEPLSHVWFLLSFMGMETFADRFQKPDPSQGQDDGEGKALENY